MRAWGVTYDTGFESGGTTTHEPFEVEVVRRDLAVIARELRCDAVLEVLRILDEEGVDTAFVNTFARRDLPTSPDPERDFDVASWGIVKVLPEGGASATHPGQDWEPKAAFHALAAFGATRR